MGDSSVSGNWRISIRFEETKPFCSKHITERPKKFSLQRPICDGKDDVGERSVIVVFQSLPKIKSSAVRIIRESTTAPCAENQRGMSVGPCDSEYAMNPFLQEIPGLRLTNDGSIWGGTCNEAQ